MGECWVVKVARFYDLLCSCDFFDFELIIREAETVGVGCSAGSVSKYGDFAVGEDFRETGGIGS